MAITLQNPPLFYTIDTALQLVSMLIALLIVGFGYKAYRFTKDKRYYYYSVAFALIAAAFFVKALSNVIIYYIVPSPAANFLPVFNWGIFAYRILMMLAFTGIMLMTLKITDRRVVLLLLVFALFSAIASEDHNTAFYILYIIILGATSTQLYLNYKLKKSRLGLATFGIFAMLTVAQALFLALILDFYFKIGLGALLYYAGQAFQITSFLLLFYVMIRISRR
ncbi:hypothetical protein HYV81_00250 [Candidatus Woesearchaeota archaeon]|nr:hypothetical protein [Candidatus Woesearchaeota archaeon]